MPESQVAVDDKPPPTGTSNQQQQSEPDRSLSEIAQDAFGAAFHGEVKTVEGLLGTQGSGEDGAGDESLLDADRGQQADAADGEEERAKSGDDSDEASDDGEGEGQTQADTKSGAGEDGEAITTFAELIESLEADPEWAQNLQVDLGEVNGKPSRAQLRELVQNYRTNQAADERLEQAKSKSAEMQQRQEQQQAALEVHFQTANKLVEAAEAQLLSDAKEIDWDDLRESDPGNWAAERTRFSERKQGLETLKNAVRDSYVKSVNEQRTKVVEAQKAMVQEQTQLLNAEMPKINPAWNDSAKVPAIKASLADYARRCGFSDEDIGNTIDHRVLLVLEKARQRDEAQGKLDPARKRVAKVPKMMKPGNQKDAGVVDLEATKKARARLAASGSIEDALAVVQTRRKG